MNRKAKPSFASRERFSHELTLAYENGQIPELKETKEAKPLVK